MKTYLTDGFWFPASFISTGESTAEAVASFKQTVADSLNASPDELHFTSGGTLANNISIKGVTLSRAVRGRHVICSVVDYPDLLTNAAFLEKIGFEVSYLEPDAQGRVSPQQLEDAF